VNEIQALYHISIGRFDQALANLRTARERDPLSLPAAIHSQFGLLVTRRYQDAIEPGLRAVARDPNAGLLRALVGVNLIYAGRNPEGVEHLEAILRVDHSYPVALLAATAFARMGSGARARRILREVKSRMPGSYICAYEVAGVHAELGEPDDAFEWLDKAQKARCDCFLWLNIEPWFDRIRGDPRYSSFSSEVTFQ
jgi:tetratricopeptide (TPR) repeat protein